MKPIDLAIIGGGCAGLSLARDIARRNAGQPAGRQVTIFEPRTVYENDRTWCYWLLKNEPHDPLVSHRWAAWQFSKATETVVHRSAYSQYCLVSGMDFYADALATIQHADGIDLHLGTFVKTVESCDGGFNLTTSTGDYLARRIVDTRPPAMTPDAKVLIYQAFAGVEIETAHPIGDPGIARLMEQMHLDQDGFGFDYVLPLGSHRWLVEATLFSPDPACGKDLPEKLTASLHRIIPGGDFRCLRREQGLIPMGYQFHGQEGPAGWVKAGTGGGAVRAASGYAYRRIQRWSEECARHFTESGEVIGHPEDSWMQRKMDFLFLKVLRNEPAWAPELFYRLARGLAPDAMARFMMDRPTSLDLLAVVWALPKRPFLRQLFNRADVTPGLRFQKGSA